MFRMLAVVPCLIALAAPVVADETKAADPATAEKSVKAFLEKHKAAYGQVTVVKDEAVAKTFGKHVFCFVIYRQYPIARELPEPLKYANIFASDGDGKLTHITDQKGLQKFFAEHGAAVKDIEPGKNAVRAWLKLSPELQQDGFFKFQIMDDSTKAELIKEQVKAAGKVVVMQGGNGEINVTLNFDANGKLAKFDESTKITAGPRPICQATKLLDADPIVRKMAVQDLLIMGSAAKGYLDEQRAKASPELQKAIDRLWQRIVREGR